MKCTWVYRRMMELRSAHYCITNVMLRMCYRCTAVNSLGGEFVGWRQRGRLNKGADLCSRGCTVMHEYEGSADGRSESLRGRVGAHRCRNRQSRHQPNDLSPHTSSVHVTYSVKPLISLLRVLQCHNSSFETRTETVSSALDRVSCHHSMQMETCISICIVNSNL